MMVPGATVPFQDLLVKVNRLEEVIDASQNVPTVVPAGSLNATVQDEIGVRFHRW